jgi:hypothetical protein
MLLLTLRPFSQDFVIKSIFVFHLSFKGQKSLYEICSTATKKLATIDRIIPLDTDVLGGGESN